MRTVSFKLPTADLRRIPAKNRSEFLRAAVREKLKREEGPQWKPKTALKLHTLSEKHGAGGAKLLTLEEVREEIRERHGGLAWR